VVLLTLGLFYRPPFEGRLKTQERSLERLWGEKDAVAIDPRPAGKWPSEIQEIYDNWPPMLLPHAKDDKRNLPGMCNRLSFMYGPPYVEKQLVPEIHQETLAVSFEKGGFAPLPGQVVRGVNSPAHGKLHDLEVENDDWAKGNAAGVLWLVETNGHFESAGQLAVGTKRVASITNVKCYESQLERQFGPIPLRMFLQAAKNVLRHGCAGEFDEVLSSKGFTRDQNRQHFDDLVVTLITGRENKLWLKRGIDDMYEWLRRGPQKPGRDCRKVILRGYAHQDLLWGKRARKDVFPKIEAALERG
jgi:hypothetical protein